MVPCYDNKEDWMYDKQVPDTLMLSIDYFSTSSKTPPIFDKDDKLTKVVKTRQTYLKDTEIIPGHTYIDARGTEYLYLGYFNFYIHLKKYDFPSDIEHDNGCSAHVYTKVTKRVVEIAEICSNMNEFINRTIYEWTDKNHNWYDKLLLCENHRKFVKENTTLIYDPTITNHIVETADFIDDYWGECCLQYEITI